MANTREPFGKRALSDKTVTGQFLQQFLYFRNSSIKSFHTDRLQPAQATFFGQQH